MKTHSNVYPPATVATTATEPLTLADLLAESVEGLQSQQPCESVPTTRRAFTRRALILSSALREVHVQLPAGASVELITPPERWRDWSRRRGYWWLRVEGHEWAVHRSCLEVQ